MVLIISTEDDQSTNDVIDWLFHFKIKFVRVSHLNKFFLKNVKINDSEFIIDFFIDNVQYKLTDFKAFWYRRSFTNMYIKPYEGRSMLNKEIKRHLQNEAQEIHRLVKSYHCCPIKVIKKEAKLMAS